MSTTPYTWPIDEACLPPSSDGLHEALLPAAIDTAIGVLWALTGRRFGLQTVVARPCTRTGPAMQVAHHGPWMVPIIDSGVWRNLACGTTLCRRDSPSTVLLPGPVHTVTGVAVDGVKLDDTSWTVEGDWLYRTDGHTWPEQDLSAPLGSPGTWSVTYQRGTPPPAGAGIAAGALAGEFLQSCIDPDKCALPRRVTQITRQGVTMQMADPQSIINDGSTGLPEVDMWVRAHNPNRLAEPSVVWSPDLAVQ